MKFKVIPYKERMPTGGKDVIYLLTDGWDDWFKFSTMYNIIYVDQSGEQHRIGEVKIGEFGMQENQRRPNIPSEFEELSKEFFSLGQDDSYYQAINDLGDSFREKFLISIRDVAKDADLFNKALGENVTGVSLLRSVSDKSVIGQFRRMANGGARLTPYSFSYTPSTKSKRGTAQPKFKFNVVPESLPPTNVHVLIGRNGVGKTHTVNLMTNALVRSENAETDFGDFTWDSQNDFDEDSQAFPNIISVTFSAFDPFEPLPNKENKSTGVRYQYIGLKHVSKDEDGNPRPPKSPSDLAADFGKSVQLIVNQTAKRERWRHAIGLLESDLSLIHI